MAHTPTCDFVLDTIPCTGRPIILYVVHSGRSRILFRVAGARGGANHWTTPTTLE